MATAIKTWQIINGKLEPIDTSLAKEGRNEPQDLESWIASYPAILASDIVIVGRQVPTKSGPMDFLGIDKSGNLVVIELKRDKLPREALAQAIDYASDIATWSLERIGEICVKYTTKSLEDFMSDIFTEADIENVNINESQRILLVGFGLESSLERMVEWLTERYEVSINAVILHYAKTSRGDEILSKTSIISEEVEQERSQRRKFTIPMSDEPGNYDEEELERLLKEYLEKSQITIQRIRHVILPYCLKNGVLTREKLKEELLRYDDGLDSSKVGYHLTVISSQLGMKKNDFLRQVVKYEYPNYYWEKDNYQIQDGYSELVGRVLEKLKDKE